jgi:hypothetical protein
LIPVQVALNAQSVYTMALGGLTGLKKRVGLIFWKELLRKSPVCRPAQKNRAQGPVF